MNKRKFIFYLALIIINFYLFNNFKISADDSLIVEKPVVSDIYYSQPLFVSQISGGTTRAEGKFQWKNGYEVFEVGEYDVVAVFTPYDTSYSQEEILLKIKVLPKRVFLKFEKELQKKYDQSDVLNVPSYIVQGIVDDSVYVSGKIAATLEKSLVAENIKVKITGLELEGEKKDNYYLDLEGYKASVHPAQLEKFAQKDKVEFLEETYIPVNSSFYVDELQEDKKPNDKYKFIKAYNSRIVDKVEKVDVSTKVKMKIKVKEDLNKIKRLKIFHLYNGVYEEVKEYEYKEGYLLYSGNGVGITVIVQKKPNYVWLYIIGGCVLFLGTLVIIKNKYKNRVKINKYKSLKRSEDNGDY